jgi:hypothetical protein
MKGLKQMVQEAVKQSTEQEQEQAPVQVTDDARRALSMQMRQWSGWANSVIEFGDPRKKGMPSPFAACDHHKRRFHANIDRLVLNPNRVLFTVTPFRLRQEAVLTGALLHEAGHARYSHWQPSRYGNPDVLLHNDGEPATAQCVALARLMEEPRIEGLMTRDAERIGAGSLDWTMRASAAHLAPMTTLATDPGQRIMDLITSWALRAGRQYAIQHWDSDHRTRNWVSDFTSLLTMSIEAHLTDLEAKGADTKPNMHARLIVTGLIGMTSIEDNTGSLMIDNARAILDLLFPETDEDDEDGKPEPMPGGDCAEQEPEEQEDSEPEQGEAEPEKSEDEQADEAEQSDEGEPGDDEAEADEGEPGESEGEDGESDEGEPSEDDAEGEGKGEGEGDPESEGEGEGEGATSSTGEPDDELSEALRQMEEAAKDESAEEAGEEAEESEVSGNGAGSGGGGGGQGGYRNPTKEERDIQKGAERFLRDMIAPSESSIVTLTDTPSSTVNGAALSAWKAGGQVKAPHFFERTRREVEPSPPVKVAILVDVSSSMGSLQKPSSVLSWALAAAALDLRNFAGRGQQIESCMIHWGSRSEVIQRNGQMMPGIKEFACDQGTSDMHGAMALVEEQMPGFFDVSETPVNRLLVQFTDWELFGRQQVTPWIERALGVGVNMLTVAPRDYSPRRSDLEQILSDVKVQRGTSSLLRYDEAKPDQVWQHAAEVLS